MTQLAEKALQDDEPGDEQPLVPTAAKKWFYAYRKVGSLVYYLHVGATGFAYWALSDFPTLFETPERAAREAGRLNEGEFQTKWFAPE